MVPIAFGLLVGLFMAGPSSSAGAQPQRAVLEVHPLEAWSADHDAGARAPEASSVPVLLEGRVLLPSGEPARGAVVVSSAGGLAEVRGDGSFTLEVRPDAGIGAIELTAVANGSQEALRAQGRVERISPEAWTPAGTLQLSQGQGCTQDWVPTFGGERPGVNAAVVALAVFDDGAGPALYVGGGFTSAGSVEASHIAKWDGQTWSHVGNGVNGAVLALAVFDEGSGPALFAGGGFTHAGDTLVRYVARWDGTSWSALGLAGMGGAVRALTVFDDGTGPALYAGGTFVNASSRPEGIGVNHVARWNGAAWSGLGGGVAGSSSPYILALTVLDDGNGPALYAGGSFSSAGGVSANSIARWDGASWSALGSGVGGQVVALAVFDDGSGPGLYAGGSFSSAGGMAASRIARWDGSSWSALGIGTNDEVWALGSFDDGGGPALYAGGRFTSAGGVAASRIARWDGASWSALGSGLTQSTLLTAPAHARALAVFDDGSGAALYTGGWFSHAGDMRASAVARWKGGSWSAVGSRNVADLWEAVTALAVFDDGTGPALYVTGPFTVAGGVAAQYIARWDGTSWSAVGGGIFSPSTALAVFDDGFGPALYTATHSDYGYGASAILRRWDGATWSMVGGLPAADNHDNGRIRTLAVFDDGAGPALYVGGWFVKYAGGVSSWNIVRWDGSSWSALGSGLEGPPGWPPGGRPGVLALAVFDDGSGPALYAGGGFVIAGGVAAQHIARWDGASWSPLGSGTDLLVRTLAVFDDGAGPALYAGGHFTSAGGVATNRVARWDGASWSALGSGVDGTSAGVTVGALAVFDDGSGPALYAGGSFTSAGGMRANGIARWDGASWSALGAGLTGGAVMALAVFDDGTGEALFAGGSFLASPAGDSHLAKWGCEEPALGIPYCFGDGGGTACPCGNAGAAGEGCANGTGQGATLDGSGSTSITAGDLVLRGAKLPAGQPAFYFQGDARAYGGAGITFGDGLLCAAGALRRLQIVFSDASGASSTSLDLAALGGVSAGDARTYQILYRDAAASPCGSGFNLTNGLGLAWLP